MASPFEKSIKNKNWPNPHKITCDGKLTYYRKTKDWNLARVYEKQTQLGETQVDGFVHAVSIDSGIRTPFTQQNIQKYTERLSHFLDAIVIPPFETRDENAARGSSSWHWLIKACPFKKEIIIRLFDANQVKEDNSTLVNSMKLWICTIMDKKYTFTLYKYTADIGGRQYNLTSFYDVGFGLGWNLDKTIMWYKRATKGAHQFGAIDLDSSVRLALMLNKDLKLARIPKISRLGDA
ncbi:hypothetical protein G9A89_021750 [Geosiphon pyriformis]|nr:hypothetical protein G9A89_021750 [Geosiphon pyriformis]